MKKLTPFICTLIIFVCFGSTPGRIFRQQPQTEGNLTPRVMRAVVAEPNVIVHLWMKDGCLTVNGWERNEVQISSVDAEQIELQRRDGTNAPQAVKRVFFNVIDKKGTVNLQVPREATVLLVVESSTVNVKNIAKVRVESGSGKVDLQAIGQVIEASSITGGISVKNSSGRIQLRSVSGLIEVIDVRPVETGNDLRVFSVSGDFLLEQIGHARVDAETTTGSVMMTNSYAPTAHYDLKTTTGNVTLTLPENTSFQVQASVAKEGKIINDFALQIDDADKRAGSQQLLGTHGNGEATLKLASFSGIVHLKRKT